MQEAPEKIPGKVHHPIVEYAETELKGYEQLTAAMIGELANLVEREVVSVEMGEILIERHQKMYFDLCKKVMVRERQKRL